MREIFYDCVRPSTTEIVDLLKASSVGFGQQPRLAQAIAIAGAKNKKTENFHESFAWNRPAEKSLTFTSLCVVLVASLLLFGKIIFFASPLV